jgi:arylsulfatase A-like enzyme
LTDVLTDYAIQFVEDPDARPFFLFLSYNAPHGPLQAPAHFVEKFRDSHNGSRSTYLAMVNALDDNLGRFQKALEKSEKDQNTLIFFLSDNGGVWAKPNHQQETWADNGILRGGKGSFYEGGIRVPMIVSWPETWPAGITFSPMVSSLDIAATAVAAAGLSPDGYDLDGVDLTPFILKQQEGRPHRFLYWRSAYEHAFAIRSEHFKLVRTGRISDPLELYHLGEDPGETDPLQNRNPERVHLLASAWNDWNLHNRNNRSVDAFLYQKKRDAFFREQARALKEQAEQAPLYQISVPEK